MAGRDRRQQPAHACSVTSPAASSSSTWRARSSWVCCARKPATTWTTLSTAATASITTVNWWVSWGGRGDPCDDVECVLEKGRKREADSTLQAHHPRDELLGLAVVAWERRGRVASAVAATARSTRDHLPDDLIHIFQQQAEKVEQQQQQHNKELVVELQQSTNSLLEQLRRTAERHLRQRQHLTLLVIVEGQGEGQGQG